MDLFSNDAAPWTLPLEGGDVSYHAAPDLGVEPDELRERLLRDIPWGQRSTRWGQEPRLTSWHADDGIRYRYSGITMVPAPMTPLLDDLRRAVERASGASYNSVLLNLYRDGRDSIGFHADDEPELGARPTIASVSLGAEREFELRRKDGTGRAHKIALRHGSMLVMAGDTQRNWKHGIRKTEEATGSRINLTFRLTRAS
jgi:alkylated DNA repair dioxygenase AlkB